MVMQCYGIYDHRAQEYCAFFFEKTDAVACRIFADACRRPESIYNRFPEDYELFALGAVCITTGQLVDEPVNTGLGKAESFIVNGGEDR